MHTFMLRMLHQINLVQRAIDDLVKIGDEIIVQVIKEPIGNKGPKITTHLTIPGRYVVLTPFLEKLTVSKKITETNEINRLLKIGSEICQEQMGMIMRTASKDMEKECIEEDAKYLKKHFQSNYFD